MEDHFGSRLFGQKGATFVQSFRLLCTFSAQDNRPSLRLLPEHLSPPPPLYARRQARPTFLRAVFRSVAGELDPGSADLEPDAGRRCQPVKRCVQGQSSSSLRRGARRCPRRNEHPKPQQLSRTAWSSVQAESDGSPRIGCDVLADLVFALVELGADTKSGAGRRSANQLDNGFATYEGTASPEELVTIASWSRVDPGRENQRCASLACALFAVLPAEHLGTAHVERSRAWMRRRQTCRSTSSGIHFVRGRDAICAWSLCPRWAQGACARPSSSFLLAGMISAFAS